MCHRRRSAPLVTRALLRSCGAAYGHDAERRDPSGPVQGLAGRGCPRARGTRRGGDPAADPRLVRARGRVRERVRQRVGRVPARRGPGAGHLFRGGAARDPVRDRRRRPPAEGQRRGRGGRAGRRGVRRAGAVRRAARRRAARRLDGAVRRRGESGNRGRLDRGQLGDPGARGPGRQLSGRDRPAAVDAGRPRRGRRLRGQRRRPLPAVAVTAGAVLGYDQQTGAPRWTALTPPGCSDQTLAGAQQSVVVLAACGRTFDVIDLDPASGKQLWRTPVPLQAPGYHFAILSADPAVVADVSPGQPEQVLAFGATGRLASTIPVGDLDTNYYQGFGPQIAVSGGLLIGVTRPGPSGGGHADVVAYRLSDGGRQWLLSMPGDVLSLRQDGGQLLVIDQSRPSLALDAISLPTGSLHPIGYIPANIVNPSGARVYSAGDRYVVVNLSGR